MQIEFIDHFPEQLNQLALESYYSSFYQTGGWLESVNAAFPGMSLCCIVARDGGAVAGYLPYFRIRKGPLTLIWSLPFGTYGGPVVSGDPAAFTRLRDALSSLGRQFLVLEVGWVDFWNLEKSPDLPYEEGLTHILDLGDGFDLIWNERFDKAKRRQTRKAEKEGLSIVQANSQEEIKRYYTIYANRMHDWGEAFIIPEVFFHELLHRGGDSVKLFLAFRGDTLLGGHLNFYFKEMVTAWNGVTVADGERYNASTFLYTSLIRHACENGFRRYNLGGSLGKETLLRYKASLGGKHYTYRIFRTTTRMARMGRSLKRFISRS